MGDFLNIEIREGGIAIMRLDRAPVNALNPTFLSAINDALKELETDKTVRALVVTSALKVLSAGLDLKEILDFSSAEERAVVDGLNVTFARFYGFSKPVVTAANGHAIAGGLFFVFCGDYRVSAPHALFGLTEVRVGVDFPIGPLEIARHEMAPHVARLIFQRGQNISAERALTCGIIDEIVDAETLEARAVELAAEYAAIPPKAYTAVKSQLRAPVLDTVNRVNHAQSDPALESWFSDETHNAARKMLER